MYLHLQYKMRGERVEEIVIKDHWSDVVEVEVRFKVARELDKLERDMMHMRVHDMVSELGPVLWESQKEKIHWESQKEKIIR